MDTSKLLKTIFLVNQNRKKNKNTLHYKHLGKKNSPAQITSFAEVSISCFSTF